MAAVLRQDHEGSGTSRGPVVMSSAYQGEAAQRMSDQKAGSRMRFSRATPMAMMVATSRVSTALELGSRVDFPERFFHSRWRVRVLQHCSVGHLDQLAVLAEGYARRSEA